MNRASSLSSQSQAATTGQFRHTGLWNNIIQHLKQSLLDSGSSQAADSASVSHRLRKQHSRFVTGGMLLIKQNLLSSTGLTPNSSCLDNLCFTGAQCVDIVYRFLTSKDQAANFERQVTREKVTKVSSGPLFSRLWTILLTVSTVIPAVSDNHGLGSVRAG